MAYLQGLEVAVDYIGVLIFLVVFGCFGLFVLAAAFLIVFLIVKKVFRGSRPLDRQQVANIEAQLSKELALEANSLAPWQPESFSEMSAKSDCVCSQLGMFTARGRCPSLHDPNRGLLAFRLTSCGQTSVLVARTASHELMMNICRDDVQVKLNGQYTGRVLLSRGHLLDSADQVVGDYERDPGAQVHVGGIDVGAVNRPYALRLWGRPIALLTTVGGRTGFKFIDGAAPPLVQRLVPNISPHEAAWLLSICALELGYHAPLRLLHRARSR